MRKSLTKEVLLRKRRDIKRLFFSSRQYACPGARLYLLSTDLPKSRVLVSLSRGFGRAVDRNYAKRVGKEVFRDLQISLIGGYDIGFVFFPGKFSYQERFAQMDGLLKRANILHVMSA